MGKREERGCLVCGRDACGRALCERCRESLALCDVEDLVSRKIRDKKCAGYDANAFKSAAFVVK